MNFSFAFQVVGMDVVEMESEMISLAAATANVIAFLMLRVERPAMPEDTAGKSREETPTGAGASRSDAATTELGVTTAPSDWGSALGAVVTRTSAEDGDTEVRSEITMSARVIRASASGAGR